MATYKPKSLDELNDFYEKAKSAEQAFQKGKSLLKEENIFIETEFPIISAAPSEPAKPEQPKPASSETDDRVLRDMDEMFKSLFPEEKPKQSQSITYSDDAPIKGKELSGLMDDYVKVMTDGEYYDDEDEGEEKRDSLLRRRKTKRKNKYLEEVADDLAVEIEGGESDFEQTSYDDFEAPSGADEFLPGGNDDFNFELPQSEYDYFVPESQSDEAVNNYSNEAYYPDEAPAAKQKSVGSIITSVLLALVFVATVIVGTLNMTLKVNTGLPTFKSLYFFTTTQEHQTIGIKSGDLVICQRQTTIADDTNVAYIDRENSSFAFGMKTEDSRDTDDYGNALYIVSGVKVKQTDVIGTVKTKIPVVGKIIRVILDNYLIVLGVLVLLAIVLTLVRCLAFREKSYNFAPKKSKKGKRESFNEDVDNSDDYNDAQGFDLDSIPDFDADDYPEEL